MAGFTCLMVTLTPCHSPCHMEGGRPEIEHIIKTRSNHLEDGRLRNRTKPKKATDMYVHPFEANQEGVLI